MAVTKQVKFGHLPSNRGAWVSGTSYHKNNIVEHNGSSFISLTEGNTTEPTANLVNGSLVVSTGWAIMAYGTKNAELEAYVNTKTNTAVAYVDAQVNNKANKDGLYEELTAGAAENLVGRGNASEETFIAKSFDSTVEDGEGEIYVLKGSAVVWNNITPSFSKTIEQGTQTKFYTVSGGTSISVVEGHKYLCIVDQKQALSSVTRNCILITDTNGTKYYEGGGAENYHLEAGIHSLIFTAAESGYALSQFWCHTPSKEVTYEVKGIYDLTKMFGSGNEPTTYAEFVRRCPKVSNPNAADDGTLYPFVGEAVKTTGRNLWDEEWENGIYGLNVGSKISKTAYSAYFCNKNKIDCSHAESYYFKRPSSAARSESMVIWCDADDIIISYDYADGVVSRPTNAVYMYLYWKGTTYKNDVCVNISNTSFNGTYEPYEEHSRPLHITDIKKDGVALFADGLKAAGSVYDEITKTKAVKRIGKVDLGTLTWTKVGTYFQCGDVIQMNYTNIQVANILCAKYATVSSYSIYTDGAADKTIGYYDGRGFRVKDSSYTDANALKTALNGVYAYYELAEPTEVDFSENEEWNGKFIEFQNGTIEVVSTNTTAPIKGSFTHGRDYVHLVEKNETKLSNHETRIAALEAALLSMSNTSEE